MNFIQTNFSTNLHKTCMQNKKWFWLAINNSWFRSVIQVKRARLKSNHTCLLSDNKSSHTVKASYSGFFWSWKVLNFLWTYLKTNQLVRIRIHVPIMTNFSSKIMMIHIVSLTVHFLYFSFWATTRSWLECQRTRKDWVWHVFTGHWKTTWSSYELYMDMICFPNNLH